ncbi:MAG: ATP-binding cassette domain-containing protein [Candidatus Riflebacteria bacterium]|nr:ATP-binding cassette domain-containing protein [Candidatus Riflebacteria bacterium]
MTSQQSALNADNEPAILTCGLRRSYEIRHKAEGLIASIKGLFKPEFSFIDAVADLDIRIEPGELVGFLGPNGAGKTTTLKMMSGLIAPTKGTVEVLGRNPFRREADFLASISLVMGQKQNLWWDLPPAETLALHREIYDISEPEYRERLKQLVDMLEIGDVLEIQARKLSLGQRMRAELAVALLHRPRILFLDEPTIGLDILMQKKVREFLLEYHARYSPTLLLTSHNMDDVAALCKRVIVINRGYKVYDGNLDRLTALARLDKILTVTFASAPPPGFDPKRLGTLVSAEGGRFCMKIPRDEAPRVAGELYNSGGVIDLTIEEAPLEDALADLFARPAS